MVSGRIEIRLGHASVNKRSHRYLVNWSADLGEIRIYEQFGRRIKYEHG